MSSSITVLPPELLLEVFGYLTPEELLDNVQNVCTFWRELVRHPSLWEDFVYRTECFLSCEDAVKFIEKCPMLKHIHAGIRIYYHDTQGLDDLISTLVRNCSDVRTFCIESGESFPSASQIDTLFEAFPNLEAFAVTVDSESAPQVVKRLSKCTKLKKLSIEMICSDCSLKEVVDGCVSLEDLFVRWPEIIEKEYTYILENMRDRLSRLTFSTHNLGTQRDIDALGYFTKLEYLYLYHDSYYGHVNFLPLANIRTLKCFDFTSHAKSIDEVGTIFDVLFVNPFPQLKELYINLLFCELYGTILNDICRCYSNLKHLGLYGSSDCTRLAFEEIHRLEYLESLNYCYSETITDNDTEHIARCCRLKRLDLVNCVGLTDKTVTNLMQCRYLEFLNLSRCSISGQSLHLIPKYLTKLRCLDIFSTTAVRNELYALADKMPLTKIHF